MAVNLQNSSAASPRVNSERANRQLKATLRKAEKPAGTADSLKDLGGCLDFARRYAGWTLDQLVGELAEATGRAFDARQVSRWIRGEERTQVDAVLCVRQLHGPFVIALANLRSDDIVVETTIRILRKQAD
jgi:hypothetical protein